MIVAILIALAFFGLVAGLISTATLTIGWTSTLLSAADFGDGHNAQDSLSFTDKDNFTNGAGANQGNQHWHDNRSVSSGADDDLDLNATLTDAFGASVTFTKVKALYIRNKSTTDALRIGGGASNEWIGAATPFLAAGDKIVLPPGADMLLRCPTAAGWTVTAGSADTLRVSHPGTTSAAISYDIAILGAE